MGCVAPSAAIAIYIVVVVSVDVVGGAAAAAAVVLAADLDEWLTESDSLTYADDVETDSHGDNDK